MDFISYLIIALLLAAVIVLWIKASLLGHSDIGRDTASRERRMAMRANELAAVIDENYAYANTLRAAAERIETANAITVATVATAVPQSSIASAEEDNRVV